LRFGPTVITTVIEEPVDQTEPSKFSEIPEVSWPEFLETVPPGQVRRVKEMFAAASVKGTWIRRLKPQEIQLHCVTCGGNRIYSTELELNLSLTETTDCFIEFRCRNCQKATKTYSIRFAMFVKDAQEHCLANKFGELPAFGPPLPSRLISLVGPDRDLFLRGRRAENLGLELGSFAYYRRVVEEQRTRLINEIGSVARKLGASPEKLGLFEKAAKETRFDASIELIKDAIPSTLLIDGQNPLKLLHSALSEGLHAQGDAECLEVATSVRVVLAELAERISSALKDEAELKTAVSRLLQKKSQK
jgi:hypothetical protein